MRRPDISKIRRLDAKEVADRLGLLDSEVKGTGEGARYRFAGYDGSHWIAFHADGKWQNFKSDWGGDALSLVQSFIAGAPDFKPVHEQEHFGDAAERIAAAFGLWETLEQARAASKKLAGTPKDDQSRHVFMRDLVSSLEQGEKGPRWEEASRLLVALDVDPHRVTLCPDGSGTGALCWQPAVPWQNEEFSRREDGHFGGWTIERATECSYDYAAFSLLVLDLDGIKGAKPDRPKSGLIDRLVRDLERRGLPVAAHVWTSFGEQDRAKAHLYFRPSRRARSIEEWQRWWDLLEQAVLDAVSGWEKIPEQERALVRAMDRSTRQISRLVRLPGYAKWGSEHAPVIERLAEDARVDFDTLEETRDLTHSYCPTDAKEIETCIGEYSYVKVTEHRDGGEPNVSQYPLAKKIWALASYVTPDGTDRGVYLRIEDRDGAVRHEPVSLGELVDKSRRISTGARLRRRGAQIWPEKDDSFLKAIHTLHFRGYPKRSVELVSRPGWHGDSYVLGSEVIGAHRGVLPNGASIAMARRERSKGTLEDWKREVLGRCTTHPLKLAVGVSLAGALLRKLGQHPFVLHVAGPSSSGKSLAPEVASSVWSSPDVQGLCNRWDTTMGAFEALAEMATDACLGLDEMARWRGSMGDLAQAIHALGDSGGRSRLEQRDGTYQLGAQRTWYCTTVSTGEVRIEDLLGQELQGGHAVRMLDLWITREEMTESREHTRQLRRACQLYHGTAARAWVEALTKIDWQSVHDLVGRIGDGLSASLPEGDGEARRVIDIIALITIALRIAFECGLTPWDAHARQELAVWAVDRVVVERVRRAMHTPNHRMLRLLLRVIDQEEALAPFLQGRNLSARPQGMIGMREVLGDSFGPESSTEKSHLFHTCEDWLHSSGLCAKAGVGALEWLQWCDENKIVLEHKRSSKAGRRRWYWTIDLEKAENFIHPMKLPGPGSPGSHQAEDRAGGEAHEIRH